MISVNTQTLLNEIKILLVQCFVVLKVILKNFRPSCVFTVSNFLKLLFIYCSAIAWIIFGDMQFSSNFFNKLITGKLSKVRISIYSVKDRAGEGVLYNRLRLVSEKEDIDYSAIRFSEALSNFWITHHFYLVATSLINYLFQPNLNLAVTHHVKIIPYGYNITYLNMPTTSLYSAEGKFKNEWIHLTKYDAYADLYTFVHGHNPILDSVLQNHNLKTKKIIPVYLAQNFLEYKEPNIKQALITGTLWGCSRGSLRVMNALKALSDDNLLVGYGVKGYLSFLGKGYKGNFDSFSSILDAMHQIQNELGIVLVIHNLEHMLEAIPTSRILEAISSGALVISDNHDFVKKHFGDNVLYFNVLASSQNMYEEIKSKILWAQSHKPEAIKIAKNAYDIFMQKFTMEKQLEYLINAAKN